MKAGVMPETPGFQVAADFREKALDLCREVLKWGKVHNLTGHRDLDSAWEDLILDGLALAPMVKGPLVLDIGSGAGFPGLPLALARPELKITLLEPRAKRVSFQKHMVRRLGLEEGVRPVMGSAGKDDLDGAKFHTVVLRAVASMERSLELARPYLDESGVIIMLRGIKDLDEAKDLGLETKLYRTSQKADHRLAVVARE